MKPKKRKRIVAWAVVCKHWGFEAHCGLPPQVLHRYLLAHQIARDHNQTRIGCPERCGPHRVVKLVEEKE